MRTLWSWDPFRELESLHRELDRVWGNTLPRWKSPFSPISFLPGMATNAYPLLNVAEEDDALRVEAMAPGVTPESLKVTVVGNQLTIAGEKPALPKTDGKEPENYHRNERAAGRFIRSITLPVDVDANKVEAAYRDGILRLTLPKAETAKPKQITVKVS